eukprot:187670_1
MYVSTLLTTYMLVITYNNSNTYNNKPYYTLPLPAKNCATKVNDVSITINAFVLFYNTQYGGKWLIASELGSNSYFAICSTQTNTPQECSSWSKPYISVSSNQCDRKCANSNTLQITIL